MCSRNSNLNVKFDYPTVHHSSITSLYSKGASKIVDNKYSVAIMIDVPTREWNWNKVAKSEIKYIAETAESYVHKLILKNLIHLHEHKLNKNRLEIYKF